MENRNKKIAKNTIALYFRMLFQMAITFWTTREILANLGVVDFGLSNVIGAVVTMFAFLANIMRSSASRYFAVNIGKGDSPALRQVFSLTFYLYLIMSVLLFILLETLGVWIFGHKLVIPADRMVAATEFYHFSVATFLVNTIAIPFTSMIIAKEDMSIFAGISILETLAKLGVAYAIAYNTFDRLSFYGMLLLGVALLHLFLNVLVSLKKYKETFLMKYWNSALFFEIFRFSSWSLFGGLAPLFSDVLVNVLLNNFFGAVINAARGIAIQVYHGANSFTENFLMAVKPQIMKLYAQQNLSEMFKLTVRGAKFGFILSLFMVIPISIDADFVLNLWLKEVPEATNAFVCLLMVNLAVDIFSNPLMAVVKATGKIALYQFAVGTMIWMKLPVSYIVLKLGFPAVSVIVVSIVISVICLFLRLLLIKRVVDFSILKFLKQAVLPALIVAAISIPLPMIEHRMIQPSILSTIIILISNAICICLFSYVIAMTSCERKKINELIRNKLCTRNH